MHTIVRLDFEEKCRLLGFQLHSPHGGRGVPSEPGWKRTGDMLASGNEGGRRQVVLRRGVDYWTFNYIWDASGGCNTD